MSVLAKSNISHFSGGEKKKWGSAAVAAAAAGVMLACLSTPAWCRHVPECTGVRTCVCIFGGIRSRAARVSRCENCHNTGPAEKPRAEVVIPSFSSHFAAPPVSNFNQIIP